MKVLVTGAQGLLGGAVVSEALARGLDVVASVRSLARPLIGDLRFEAADLTDPRAVRRLVATSGANAIVHTAAWTDVDACEDAPDAARKIHADASGALAAAAEGAGAAFVHVSTDSIFSGSDEPRGEEDAPAPINAYAHSKLEGEERVLSAHPRAVVVRTNFYGARLHFHGGRLGLGKSLAEWALTELRAGRSVVGFEDVRFNPLWTGHLAGFLLDLLERRADGIVHVASREATTKLEFLRALARAFDLDPALVRPGLLTDRAWRAPRPACTVLDVRRAEALLGRRMPDLAEGLRAFRLRWAFEHVRPEGGAGGSP